MSQMIDVGSESRKDVNKTHISDICSSFFIMSISLGEFIGPILVSQLLDNFSWKTSCIIM